MLRAVPFVLAALVIVALTLVEGSITERWVDVNRDAAYCATLLDEVPAQVGDWVGADQEVQADIQRVAGAQGYVSRNFVNEKTGQSVVLWLIVGHARDTAEHTPDSCYPVSGFEQCQENFRYEVDIEGAPVQFWTGMFNRSEIVGEINNRVFWTWFKPTEGGELEWIAPDNPRFHFGSTKALYKLYFTTQANDSEQPPEESVCLEFAQEFLPVLNKILVKANEGVPADFVPPTEEV